MGNENDTIHTDLHQTHFLTILLDWGMGQKSWKGMKGHSSGALSLKLGEELEN